MTKKTVRELVLWVAFAVAIVSLLSGGPSQVFWAWIGCWVTAILDDILLGNNK